MSGRKITTILLGILIVLFLWGVIHLFMVRFGRGDIYPAYSSLRSDPLGTRVMYEALDRLDQIEVRRHFEPLKQIRADEKSCILFIGVRAPGQLRVSRQWLDDFNALMDMGARVVVSLTGSGSSPRQTKAKSPDEPDTSANEQEKRKEEATKDSEQTSPDRFEPEPVEPKPVHFLEHLGIDLLIDHSKGSKDSRASFKGSPAKNDTLSDLAWPFYQWFDVQNDQWETLWTVEDYPVVVERSYRKGSIVLLADSYVFSNEALYRENHAAFLAHICDGDILVFNETHLGIQKRLGVSTLVKRYRLFGLVGVIVGFFILLFWKNSSVLIPPDKDMEVRSLAREMPFKDSHSGLVGLLRRHIGPGQVIGHCRFVYQQSLIFGGKRRTVEENRLKAVDQIIKSSAGQADPVRTYNDICHIIGRESK